MQPISRVRCGYRKVCGADVSLVITRCFLVVWQFSESLYWCVFHYLINGECWESTLYYRFCISLCSICNKDLDASLLLAKDQWVAKSRIKDLTSLPPLHCFQSPWLPGMRSDPINIWCWVEAVPQATATYNFIWTNALLDQSWDNEGQTTPDHDQLLLQLCKAPSCTNPQPLPSFPFL